MIGIAFCGCMWLTAAFSERIKIPRYFFLCKASDQYTLCNTHQVFGFLIVPPFDDLVLTFYLLVLRLYETWNVSCSTTKQNRIEQQMITFIASMVIVMIAFDVYERLWVSVFSVTTAKTGLHFYFLLISIDLLARTKIGTSLLLQF